jgi:hypothetical protein
LREILLRRREGVRTEILLVTTDDDSHGILEERQRSAGALIYVERLTLNRTRHTTTRTDDTRRGRIRQTADGGALRAVDDAGGLAERAGTTSVKISGIDLREIERRPTGKRILTYQRMGALRDVVAIIWRP